MKRYISILLMLITVILMLIPYGVAMTFISSPTERITKYFSYFSMIPPGYGNWFPIIIAFLSIIILLLLILNLKRIDTVKVVQTCLLVCMIISILSWVMFSSVSIVGICILVLHIVVFILNMQLTHANANDSRP